MKPNKVDRPTWREVIEAMLAALFTGLILFFLLTADCRKASGQIFIAGEQATSARAAFGKKLFFDRRVSADGTVSCADCHKPELFFTDGQSVSTGIDGRTGTRNAPTVATAFQSPVQFWDTRVIGANAQALGPLTNPDEMGNDSRQQVYNRLNRIAYYRDMAAALYPGKSGVDDDVFSHAVHSYETQVMPTAPIDRFLRGDVAAISPEAAMGYELARRAQCFDCHRPPFYTDNQVHNVGAAFLLRTGDQGREGITNDAVSPQGVVERRAFKTPTLYGVGLTAPYFHDGSVGSLDRVVELFANGFNTPDGFHDAYRDPRVKRQPWGPVEKSYVVRFLSEAFRPDEIPAGDRPPLP